MLGEEVGSSDGKDVGLLLGANDFVGKLDGTKDGTADGLDV